nr:Transmembrane protein [Ipomoea batatas]
MSLSLAPTYFLVILRKSKLANPQAHASTSSSQSWILAAGSLLLLILVAAHVLALVYWVFRLATEKQSQRKLYILSPCFGPSETGFFSISVKTGNLQTSKLNFQNST